MDAGLFSSDAPDLDKASEVFAAHYLPCLREAIAAVRWFPERSESNPFLTKIVIAVDPVTDVELRLHIYAGKDKTPNVHDHRWSFYSMVISGKIEHVRYAKGEQGFVQTKKAERLGAGDIYYMGEDEFHTAVASDDSVTLLLRGPRRKDAWEMYNAEGDLVREFASPREDDQTTLCAATVGGYFAAILTSLFN